MDSATCGHLGLSANPFRADATAQSAVAWHVEQAADREFWAVQREVLHGRGPRTAAVVGAHGSGKTHRLLVAGQRAAKAGAFHALQSVANCRPDALVARLASSVLAGCRLGGLDHALAAPKWYRAVIPMTRRSALQGEPAADGRDLARALNANAPAFLLLDDLHTLPMSRAADRYIATLGALRGHLDPGVLVAWTCEPQRFEAMTSRDPELVEERFGPGAPCIRLAPLDDEQACQLLAARLAGERTAEGLDALYPFRAETVAAVNRRAGGNPQHLLRLADLLLEAAARRRDYEIEPEAVDALGPWLPPGSLAPTAHAAQ